MNIRRAHKKRSRVDLAPLIDVVFLLLIFFMLTFAVQGQGMDMLLPKESAAAEPPQQPVVIAIQTDGTLQLNGQMLTLDALLGDLKQVMQNRNEKQVVIESNQDVRYEVFVQVLDITRQAGVSDYSIVM
ncbi:ExbD/TolR family protein [Nitrospina watsonii]|uniref:Biopolymer transport protein ExbD/TolR n=1 Tax=Nitrospina watsonii TaxID=1323948 RepID=A0ABN8VWY7_9BACT|nr:biopolymer transporter ExbD [Nitrospina watsonii]CAI2717675.1 Biopolymer transport protein ExbD/TolR [Nitrospina watsonii]